MPILMPRTEILARVLIRVLLAMPVAGWDAIAPAAAQDKSVLTYHGDVARSGAFVVPGLTWERARALRLDTGFQASFPGHVYAQPLYWRDSGLGSALLIVSTEDDGIHALDAATGKPVWDRSLGQPVPLGSLPCGNIDPLGSPGRPVIDEASQAIFLDAVVAGPSGPRHLVFALSLRDGSVIQGWPVDVGEALRRDSARLSMPRVPEPARRAHDPRRHRVYVPYRRPFRRLRRLSWLGPRHLDCAIRKSWRLAHARPRRRHLGPGRDQQRRAGRSTSRPATPWAPANGATAKRCSGLRPISAGAFRERHDFFAPADWRALDERDADLGGSNPLPLDVPSGGRGAAGRLGARQGPARLSARPAPSRRDWRQSCRRDRRDRSDPHRPCRLSRADGVFVAFQGQGANCPAAQGNGGYRARVRAGAPPTIDTAWCGAMRGGGCADRDHDRRKRRTHRLDPRRRGRQPAAWISRRHRRAVVCRRRLQRSHERVAPFPDAHRRTGSAVRGRR